MCCFFEVMNAPKDKIRIEEIASRIKTLRIKAGYRSYQHFAIENDLDARQYFRLEKGQNLKLSSLFRILNIHGITPSEFFKGLD
ncbi:XRE family transcriptional regulator [Fulvivirgaceae bacterium BMA12]|uniref:XRE family transcriptional regulator n=1 Tax=Agaribacillus aureus TaxID=3051825 RepID=A0ABT8LCQ9_9BACT|nr:XRE family transcriptional regulator [Fulvivirgaceae bacterium BMA12]